MTCSTYRGSNIFVVENYPYDASHHRVHARVVSSKNIYVQTLVSRSTVSSALAGSRESSDTTQGAPRETRRAKMRRRHGRSSNLVSCTTSIRTGRSVLVVGLSSFRCPPSRLVSSRQVSSLSSHVDALTTFRGRVSASMRRASKNSFTASAARSSVPNLPIHISTASIVIRASHLLSFALNDTP